MNGEHGRTIKIYTDGGARGNPGPSACAFVVYEEYPSTGSGLPASIMRAKRGKYLGIGTNNEAEYQGIIEALMATSETEVNFFLDSLLVVNQLNGLWKVKEAKLRDLVLKIRGLETGRVVSYTHVPREQNQMADLLVNETLDQQMV